MYKKKNNLIWIVLGIIFLVLLTGTIYLAWSWPKEKKEKDDYSYEKEIQQLQTRLNLLQTQLSSLPSSNKKDQLKSKLSFLENSVNDLAKQKSHDESIVKNLKKEIEKLKKRLENDRPDEDPGPGKEKEGRFFFVGKGVDSNGNENYMFEEKDGGRDRIISVNKNHPRIKELLNQGKLKEVNKKEKFIIYFNNIDDYKTKSKFSFFFNESSTKLKIIEDDDKPEDDYEDRISTIFKWSNSDKSGYQLFKSAKQREIKVYVAKDHSFIKGKRLDDSDSTPPFSIRFKKKNSSKREGDKNFYFDKDNTNFELGAFDDWPDEPKPDERKEEKVRYFKENSLGNYVFSDNPIQKDSKIFLIVGKNHPRIKQMLSEGKLKVGKKFVIRYGKVDKNFTSISFFFDEFNEELEIIESS